MLLHPCGVVVVTTEAYVKCVGETLYQNNIKATTSKEEKALTRQFGRVQLTMAVFSS